MPDRPGRKIRVAHSVEILVKRLDDVEHADAVDAMELVGIWDELARVDRKWRTQIAEGSERRRPGDEEKMSTWFARLIRQIDRTLRRQTIDPAERAALETARQKSADRKPF